VSRVTAKEVVKPQAPTETGTPSMYRVSGLKSGSCGHWTVEGDIYLFEVFQVFQFAKDFIIQIGLCIELFTLPSLNRKSKEKSSRGNLVHLR
jgi:hypothetical protein